MVCCGRLEGAGFVEEEAEVVVCFVDLFWVDFGGRRGFRFLWVLGFFTAMILI